MRITRHIALLVLGTIIGVGCSNTDNPVTPGGSQIMMIRMADVPLTGGDATSVAFIDDQRLVAVIDGKLYVVPTSGGPPTLMHGDADYVAVVASPTGEIYAQTSSELRVFSFIGGKVTIAPVPINGPSVEKTSLRISPAGDPYMLVYSYPNTLEVWFSTDKGARWVTLPLPPGFTFGGGITWGYADQLMLSSAVGFYTSTTFGFKWTPHAAAIPNVATDVFCAENGYIYAYQSGRAGLRVSRNGGVSFEQLQSADKAPYFVEILQGSDKALYAIANRSLVGPNATTRPMSLLRSTDDGASWQHAFYTQAFDLDIRNNMIAVGQGASSAGVCLSRDLGATWTSSGLGRVGRIDDIGFDKDGNLLILADKALYRRASTVWQIVGSQAAFARMTTAPLGRMYIGQGATMFSSFDHGVSWNERVLTDYVYPGVGTIMQPAVVGMMNGDFLISVTTYRADINPQTHTAGAMYRMSDDGIPRRMSTPGNFVKLVEDRDGDVHGTTVNLSDNFISMDHGTSWRSVSGGTPAVAVNRSNKYISLGAGNTFRLGSIDNDQTSELTLLHFTSQTNLVTSMKFDANDRLYVVTADRGIFYSETPLK